MLQLSFTWACSGGWQLHKQKIIRYKMAPHGGWSIRCFVCHGDADSDVTDRYDAASETYSCKCMGDPFSSATVLKTLMCIVSGGCAATLSTPLSLTVDTQYTSSFSPASVTVDREYAEDNHLPWPGDKSIVQLYCFAGCDEMSVYDEVSKSAALTTWR